MKRSILQTLACLVFALGLPLAVWHFFPPAEGALPADVPAGVREAAETPLPAGTGSEAAENRGSPAGSAVTAGASRRDQSITVTLLRDGEIVSLTMAEYLPGVIAGEMPASFAADALRAQAAAARTYVMYRQLTGSPSHPEADVCDDPHCCQVWLGEDRLREQWGEDFEANYAAVSAAAADTDGQYLAYGGEPILACFHASSAGQTENCAAIWGSALPYLISVPSPETEADVPNYVSTVTLTAEEFRARLKEAVPQADLSGAPETWVGQRVLDTGNRVASIRVGGAALSGTQARAVFGLRSASFTLAWTGENFVFTVTGSGHGAGMSQYGANVMAKSGSGWREILAHYYPGTELRQIG